MHSINKILIALLWCVFPVFLSGSVSAAINADVFSSYESVQERYNHKTFGEARLDYPVVSSDSFRISSGGGGGGTGEGNWSATNIDSGNFELYIKGGDLDGDSSYDDIISYQDSAGTYKFYAHTNGDPWTKQEIGTISNPLWKLWSFTLSDYDNDGDSDLFVVSNSTTTIYLYLFKNNGGSWSVPTTLATFSFNSTTDWFYWYHHDIDNDLDGDVLMALWDYDEPNGGLYYVANSGGTFGSATTIKSTWNLRDFTFDDFDNDDDEDVMVVFWEWDNAWYWKYYFLENDGNNNFAQKWTTFDYDSNSYSWAYLDGTDLDGDSDEDVIAFCYSSSASTSYFKTITRTSNTNWNIQSRLTISGRPYYRGQVADLDDDSDNDIVISYDSSSTYYLYLLRNGGGSWNQETIGSTSNEIGTSYFLFWMNTSDSGGGESQLSIFSTEREAGSKIDYYFYENDGSASFTKKSIGSVPFTYQGSDYKDNYGVWYGYFDGDGDTDFLTYAYDESTESLNIFYFDNQGPTFRERFAGSSPGKNRGAYPADYDKNGWGDIVFGTYNGTVGNITLFKAKIGRLVPYLVSPNSSINVTQYEFFNVTTGVRCEGGECKNIKATLDPYSPQHAGTKVKSKVLSKFESEDEVDVIVILEDVKQPSKKSLPKTKKQEPPKQKDVLIKEREEEVLSSLDISDFRVKRKYSTVAAFSGKLTKKGLEKLKKNPNVKGIYIDELVYVTLDTSTPLINADDVWNKQFAGINVTGNGETVCVIDSGVNYSHSDLGSGWGIKVIGGYDFVNDDTDPMDDHGHGSHVAGIVASNDTTYAGVAPDANIVAIKALNVNGSGYTSDIMAGVDWCVGNATEYNISVISMSLGNGLRYATPCDDNSPYTTSIDAAVEKGIFVAVASGNDYYGNGTYSEGISSPACIKNSTSVGATNDTDNIASFTNRGRILDLLAPGHNINATEFNGTQVEHSGTSMATPHVSGLAALLQQYYKLKYNRSLTPSGIKHLLKYNGVNIFDYEGTGYNFTRVDALAATQAKGDIPTTIGAEPFYTISANPHNASCLTHLDDGESCNQTWVVNATGPGNSVWEFFTIYETDYEHNTTDRVNITIIKRPPIITVISPQNTSYNISNVSLNVTANEPVDTWWYSLDGGSINITQNATFTGLTDGQHNVTVYANDSLGNFNYTTVSFTIDTAVPYNVTIFYPRNDTNISTSSINFNWSASDNISALLYTEIIIDGVTNVSGISIENATITNYTVDGLSEGPHNWSITASDLAGNSNSSVVHQFTVDTIPPRVTNLNISPFKPYENQILNISVDCIDITTLVEKLYFNITYPSGSTTILDANAGVTYYNDSLIGTQYGRYNVQVWANDSLGNINNTESKSFAVIRVLSNNTIIKNGSTEVVINNSLLKLAATSNNQSNSTLNLTVEVSADPNHFGLDEINATYYDTLKVLNLTNATDLSNLTRISLNVSYADENMTGILEDTLSMYHWNGSWVRMRSYTNQTIGGGPFVFGAGINTTEDYVWAEIDHFSEYSIGGLKDTDLDTVADIGDNCPNTANTDQTNSDPDDQGDACDTDDDNDGILDVNDDCTTQAGPLSNNGCPVAGTPSGGGGGGGGGSGTNVIVKEMQAGEPAKFVFPEGKAETAIIPEIVLTPNSKLYNTKITLELQKKNPTSIEPSGETYKWMSIRCSQKDQLIDEADITFKIEKQWLEDNDIDPETVVMERQISGSELETLETKKKDSEESYVIFSAKTEGFSYFAMSGEKGSGYSEETKKFDPALAAIMMNMPKKTQSPEATVAPIETPAPLEEATLVKEEKKGICGPMAVILLAMLPLFTASLLRRNS
jgi:PGF-pre-PGF domain-containing protein